LGWLAFLSGWPAAAAGGREEGSQPYLGARGAGCCPGDKMFDRVSPPAGMRPLSLTGPSAWLLAAGAGSG